MVSDPDLLRYACIGHKLNPESSDATILAEFNSADSSLQEVAHKCLDQAPAHHSVYSHSYRKQSYSFLFDIPFIIFGIFDSNVPKSHQFQFLGRLKEVLHRLLRGGNPSNQHKFTSLCFQGDLHRVFHKLLSESFDIDSLQLGSNGVHSISTPSDSCGLISGSSKNRKFLAVPLLGPKMKGLCGDGAGSREALVDAKTDLSDFSNDGDSKRSREMICHNGVCYVDGSSNGGKQKAKRIWRRHVWIVLALDLAVCLILFGIWLFVCGGFECIER